MTATGEDFAFLVFEGDGRVGEVFADFRIRYVVQRNGLHLSHVTSCDGSEVLIR
jgi:hypothetical protein